LPSASVFRGETVPLIDSALLLPTVPLHIRYSEHLGITPVSSRPPPPTLPVPCVTYRLKRRPAPSMPNCATTLWKITERRRSGSESGGRNSATEMAGAERPNGPLAARPAEGEDEPAPGHPGQRQQAKGGGFGHGVDRLLEGDDIGSLAGQGGIPFQRQGNAVGDGSHAITQRDGGAVIQPVEQRTAGTGLGMIGAGSQNRFGKLQGPLALQGLHKWSRPGSSQQQHLFRSRPAQVHVGVLKEVEIQGAAGAILKRDLFLEFRTAAPGGSSRERIDDPDAELLIPIKGVEDRRDRTASR
jgi:hypothetical protein